jgi:hypothetical protein
LQRARHPDCALLFNFSEWRQGAYIQESARNAKAGEASDAQASPRASAPSPGQARARPAGRTRGPAWYPCLLSHHHDEDRGGRLGPRTLWHSGCWPQPAPGPRAPAVRRDGHCGPGPARARPRPPRRPATAAPRSRRRQEHGPRHRRGAAGPPPRPRELPPVTRTVAPLQDPARPGRGPRPRPAYAHAATSPDLLSRLRGRLHRSIAPARVGRLTPAVPHSDGYYTYMIGRVRPAGGFLISEFDFTPNNCELVAGPTRRK